MEFWGIEVKPGETVKCEPGDDKYLHLSQASLGEVKKEKGNENVPVYLKFDNQQLVIGTLSVDKCPQITYDLVFEKEFELSHNWKNGSVFFVGYKTEIQDEGPDEFMGDTDSESEEDIPVKEANGKPKSKDELAKTKANTPKTDSLVAKPSVKAEELNKVKKEEDEGDSDEDEDESDEDEFDDEDMLEGEDGSSDEDESSEEEDDATPKNEIGKKRAADSALKTPAGKKAKLGMPVGVQKTGGTDGKKGGHVATPHPAKQAGKTPATSDKSKPQTPKFAGSVPCKSCSKTFKDDNALQAHTKAKHAAK